MHVHRRTPAVENPDEGFGSAPRSSLLLGWI